MDGLQWGDVPSWVTIAGNLGPVLFRSIQRTRLKHAQSWPQIVEGLVNLPADAITHILENNPAVAELVARSWEAATQASAPEKRRLLAKVAAQALTHPDDDASIDELSFLQRALGSVAPADLKLLVIIGTPRQGKDQFAHTQLEGYLNFNDLVEAWPAAGDFISPIIAVLVREGLIENRATSGDMLGSATAWGISRFGRRLLVLLAAEDAWGAEIDVAELALRMEDRGPARPSVVVARNLGPGAARDVRITLSRGPDGRSRFLSDADPDPFDLEPEQEREFRMYPRTVGDQPPYDAHVAWHDARGEHENKQALRDR